jgi:NADPH:quinone reductase-like Zn-dependent oxidoreductase
MQSGALSEYIVCDRRRIARTPFPSNLTLEQMSLLPLQGIPAIRAIRARLIRHSRAIICDAHQGIPALICQELARAGVHVTALVSGGQDHHSAQRLCMAHGAKGVLTGKPAAVMNGLDEGWDFIVETQGGQNAYDAARRILKDGGK